MILVFKLPKESDHPRKLLINIPNVDGNECFKWCIVRYLYAADCNPARITKADKETKRLDFKDLTFHKLKKIILSALVFLTTKRRKNIQCMYPKKMP